MQNLTNVQWDPSLTQLEMIPSNAFTRQAGIANLFYKAVKFTTGALAANAGHFIAGAIIQNSVTGIIYQNIGTTSAPVWAVMENGGLVPLNNMTATVAPTVSNDSSQGYSIGSIWFNNSTELLYIAQSVAVGAASWTLVVSGAADVLTATVSLSSAQILALNGTPIQMIPSPGAGKTIMMLEAIGQMTFAGAAYATHTELDLNYHGQSAGPLKNTTLLPIASGILIDSFVAGTQSQLLSATAVDLTVPAGNPIAGSGTLKMYITYKIITL